MLLQILLVTVFIKLSQEECERKRDIYSHYIDYEYRVTVTNNVSCTGLTPNFNLRNYILSNMGDSLDNVTVTNSTIPEISEGMFHNISSKCVNIQAEVEIIQNRAFENCSISSIILDSNHIKTIKDSSFNSSSIQVLSLKSNSLSEIADTNFLGLTNLKKLNLGYNRIGAIEGGSFIPLKSLEEIDLSHNNLVEIHYEPYLGSGTRKGIFHYCESLKSLDVSYNYLADGFNDYRYGYLPRSLLYVNASNNQLTTAEFSNLINVQTIDVSYNKLTSNVFRHELPQTLRTLYINYNSLGSIVTLFSSVSFLENMELSGNGLKYFTCSLQLYTFKHLTRFSLSENDLVRLDFSRCNIHLTKLNLSRNFLSEIKNLSTLQDLTELDISFNSLEEIEYDKFDNMKNLQKLYLQFNSIHVIHMGSFRDLRNLTYMDISHNKITNIELGVFTGANELASLNISHNNLIRLGKYIFHNLRKLTNLDIAYNNLRSIEIDNAIDNVIIHGELRLTGNNWTCKSLRNLIRTRSMLKLTECTSYNVSNVFGIPCNNYDLNKHQDSEKTDMLYLNSIKEYEKDISLKTTINILLLVVGALILVFLTLSWDKCFHCYNATKQFFYKKNVNEGEIHLT